jgi:hypothetical protein
MISIGNRALNLMRHPRTHKIAIWTASIVAGIGILLGLIAPPLLRGKLAAELGKKLHRQVSIGQIKLNPYTMTVALREFTMRERQSQTMALSFDELFVNLDIRSLLRLAPVIEELRLTKPYVNLVRHPDGKYNFQDLIDEFTAGPPGPTPRFALNNIQIIDGKIDFDDQPEQTKHSVTALKVGVPFISSLPSHIDIKVKPEFYALINGAPFHLAGDTTTPFKDTLESRLSLDIDKLEVAKYVEYAPVALNFKVPAGQLNGKVAALFKTSKSSPSVLALSGNLALADLALQQRNGAPLLKLPSFEVVVDAFEVFAQKAALKSITSAGLEVHIQRDRKGEINLTTLVTRPVGAGVGEVKKESGKPFNFVIEGIAIGDGTIHFSDEQPPRPYKTRLDNVNLKVSGLSNEPDKKANVDLSFESAAKEKFAHAGTLQLTPLLAEGKLEIAALKPAALSPYYESALAAEIKDGALDLSTQYSFAEKAEQTEIKLANLNAGLRALRLELAGQPEPLWRVAALALKDGAVDVNKKTIAIAALEAKAGTAYVQRDVDGMLNLARVVKSAPAEAGSAAPAKKDEGEWKIDVKLIGLDRFTVAIDDRATATPVKTNLSDLSLRAENFSSAKNSPAKITLRSRVNNKGAVRMAGLAAALPPSAKLAVEADDIEILPFQPYLENHVNFLLTGGALGARGNLSVDGSGGAVKVSYDGGVRLADFGMVEKTTAQDLLKWNALALDAIRFNSEPFQLRIGEIGLADFYARVIVGADGKINLQNLAAPQVEPKTASAKSEKPPVKTAPPPAGDGDKAISIGKINLANGNINISDFFIKPNYSANLTGVQGAITELKPEVPGDLAINARLDNAAPVEIKGKLNPLSKELFLDLVADAKEIELSPMTPYSAKYVGYGIEKGKLSFNVKYKLDNRKLNAENKIILNQLTFGQKIDSPDATKLPVLLAVALLKDRNGVIDIDLPIGGSLDDPQFSVGGIVWQIIVNVITKAITAPFSLLAAAFGGGSGGDELSFIEFDNGRSSLNQAAQTKIATLAKALNNRPALNLELSGRVEPVTDLDGLRRVGLERKVKAQKLKELIRRGAAAKSLSLDDVQVDGKEYPQFLKAAYGEETFPKPRNIIGLAVDLPVPEMEKLMLQHAKAGDEELRQLAGQRTQAVRDALLAAGQIGAERLFIVAAKPLTSEETAKMKGKPNRVDFAMK